MASSRVTKVVTALDEQIAKAERNLTIVEFESSEAYLLGLLSGLRFARGMCDVWDWS
jgi:hypothetical protein